MRRLYQFLAGILAIIFFLWGISAYMQSRTGNVSDKLVIYNWGDYIDPDLLTKFTKETGIKVQYETFDSNEAMYTKIKQGGTTYDIAVPSDYTIDKMVKEDLLVKLDKSRIKGFDQIGSSFKGLSFDPHNDYSIPYFWGTVGIVYNTKLVKKAPQHWDDLWSPDYKNQIMLVDGAREVLGFSLNSLGYSLNTKNMTELRLAETKLNSLTPNIKAIVWTSKGRPHLLNITITTGRRKQGHRHGIKESTLTSPCVPTNQKKGSMVKLGEIDDFLTIRSKIGQF